MKELEEKASFGARDIPELMLWTAVFALSLVVGALGWTIVDHLPLPK